MTKARRSFFLAVALPAAALSLALAGPAEAGRKSGSWDLPSPLPPKISVAFDDLAGEVVVLEDKAGPFRVSLGEDGYLSFEDDGQTKPFRGAWWVDPLGRLCFVSATYWKTGTCFQFHGDAGRAEGAVPDTAPDQWFRVIRLGD